MEYCIDDLPRAWGGPAGEAHLRVEPEDFQVTEIPVCLPQGEGEHLWLRVRKRNANTEWVARQLVRGAGITPAQVSYAGLKDRHAVTEQWFSLHLPGLPDPDPAVFLHEDFQVLEAARHNRKLRRGALIGNRFRLRLRDFRGDAALLEQRLRAIASCGVPNYFGEQRFGHDGANLTEAMKLFTGQHRKLPRHQRGLYLSAARGYLFNHILAERVRDGSWNQVRPGDFLQLDGRHGGFIVEAGDAEAQARADRLEIHPTGPLWGRGRPRTGEQCSAWEQERLQDYSAWCEGLERAGLEVERRALRVRVEDSAWEWEDDATLQLSFTLTAGAYATMVLREALRVTDQVMERDGSG